MKKNLGTFILASRWGVGVVLMAFCAFTPVSRADVIVDNTGATTFTHLGGAPVAQVFTMPGYSGDISSLTLELCSAAGGTANVDLYNVSGGVPTGSATLLGTVTAGIGDKQVISVSSLNNVTLTAGDSYAIALDVSGPVSWDYTQSSAAGGDGTFGSIFTYDGVNWNTYAGGTLQLGLQTTPVPEVPMTGAVMGFGALAVALGHTLRRKLSSVFSSIA